MTIEFEIACRLRQVREFVRSGLRGKITVHLTGTVLTSDKAMATPKTSPVQPRWQ